MHQPRRAVLRCLEVIDYAAQPERKVRNELAVLATQLVEICDLVLVSDEHRVAALRPVPLVGPRAIREEQQDSLGEVERKEVREGFLLPEDFGG